MRSGSGSGAAASSDGSLTGCLGRYSIVLRIERPDICLARVVLPALVEAAAGFLADPAAREHLVDERRELKLRAAAVRQARGEIVGDMHEDVESRDVDGAERRALRPADRGARDRIDFLDRIRPGGERLENAHEPVHRDVVGDESRRVLRDDDVLAEPAIGKVAHGRDDGRIGLGRRNELEQRQVSRRIEKMRAEPVSAEIVAAPFGQARNRQARRIRADDGAGAAQSRRHARAATRFASACSMMASMIQSADAIHSRSASNPPVRMRPTASGVKNGSGLSLRARSRPSRAACARHVEQRDRVSGVGQMCGDLRAHRSGAQHAGGSYSQ